MLQISPATEQTPQNVSRSLPLFHHHCGIPPELPGDTRYTGPDINPGKACPMLRGLFVLIAFCGLALWSPADALESGISCDIEDDAVQPDTLKDLERILRELSAATS